MKARFSRYIQVLVLVLTVLVFVPTLQGDFLNWDDTTYITGNEILSEDVSFESFLKLYEYDAYISLTLFSFQVQTKILGNDPFFFHLINIFIHLINVFLVFYLAKALFKDRTSAFWIALIFAVHPYRVESVAWMIQRKDLLYTMFFLSGIITYIKFIKTERILWYLVTLLLAYLAILSKVAAVTFVIVLFLIEYFYKSKISLKAFIFILIIGLIQIIIKPSQSFFIYSIAIFLYPVIVTNIFNKYLFLYNNRNNNNLSIKKSSNYISNINQNYISNINQFSSKRSILIAYRIVFIAFVVFCILQIIVKTMRSNQIDILNAVLYDLVPLLIFYSLMSWKHLEIFDLKNRSKFNIKVCFVIILLSLIALYFFKAEIFLKIDTDALNIDTLFTFKTIYLLIYSVNFYILGFLFPFYQNGMIPYPDSYEINIMFFIFLAIFIVLINCMIYFIKNTKDIELRKKIIFGLLFFIVNIIVVLHIIPIKGKVIVAERYSYLSYFGLIIILVSVYKYLVQKYSKNFKYLFTAGLSVTIICYSLQSFSRSYVFKDSYSFWSDAIDKNPKNHYAIFSLGLYYFEKADYKTSIAKYNEAINQHSGNHEYYLNRGSCYFKLDSIDLALIDYKQAELLNPGNYLIYKNRGILNFETGNLERALNDFNLCLELNPKEKYVSELHIKANFLWSEYLEFNNTAKISKDLSNYFFRLATNSAKKSDYLRSINLFNESLRYDSLNIDALKNRGNVFALLKRFDEAKRDYKQALEINPNDAGLYLNLGNILHELGENNAACENWNKAKELGRTDVQKMIDQFCK